MKNVKRKKKIKSPKLRKTKELNAKRRAEIILKVRSGIMTATAAASELGVSRKTYYEWEDKAFAAMTDALTDKEPGRPALPPEAEENKRLRKHVRHQEKYIDDLIHREHLIKSAYEFKLQMEKGRAEKKCGDCGAG
jgi:transposase